MSRVKDKYRPVEVNLPKKYDLTTRRTETLPGTRDSQGRLLKQDGTINKISTKRPPKFTAPNKRKILLILGGTGLDISVAARAIGVTKQTVERWLARGEQAGPDSTGINREFYEFYESCMMASAKPEVGLAGIAYRMAFGGTYKVKGPDGVKIVEFEPDPEMVKWLLSRQFGKDFGAKSNLKVAGNIDHEHKIRPKIDLSSMSDEELDKLHDLSRKVEWEEEKRKAIDAEIVE